MTVLNIAQCNAQRIGTDLKINRIYTTCVIENIDIINFQEINVYRVTDFFLHWEWKVHFNTVSGDAIGIATAFKPSLNCSSTLKHKNGRILGLLFGTLQVWNVYGHSGKPKMRNSLYENDLPQLLMQWQGRGVTSNDNLSSHTSVWCWDSNGVTRKIDVSKQGSGKISPSIAKTAETFGMRDIYEIKNGNKVPVDYTRRQLNLEGSRIDQIWINNSLLKCWSNLQHIPNPKGSDQDLVSVEISIDPYLLVAKGYSHSTPSFKFPSQLSSDPIFAERLKKLAESVTLPDCLLV